MGERDYSHRLLIDKLGVKPAHRVSVLGVDDETFWQQALSRAADVSRDTAREDCDVIVYAANEPTDLARIAELKLKIRPDGMIWVVSPKGRRDYKDADVMAAGLAAGLVDVKVCSFNAALTATKLVFRRKDRPQP